MSFLAGLLLLLSAAAILYTAAAALLVGRWRAGPAPLLAEPPAATLLKPLHGAEPRLHANLMSFLQQDYPAAVEMVCGVGSETDGAIPAVHALAHHRVPVRLVIDPARHGANAKIGNILNMMPAARHDLLVLADSDIAVTPDYLGRIAAALSQPGVGAVTCLYAGRGDAGDWSRFAAAGISWHFLPSVMVGLATGIAKPCMGSTIALRRETLERIGGFARFADVLADDHAIGAAVRSLGLRVEVPPMLVAHSCSEISLRALCAHELRWQATVRDLDPWGYAGSLVAHPVPLALIALLAGGGRWAVAALLLALAVRILLAVRIDRLAGRRTAPLLWLPGRDLLTFGLFLSAFLVRRIEWRGSRLRMEREGRISSPWES